MSLVLTFAGVAFVVATMLWLMATVLQPYFYTETVPYLGVRSLIAGLLLAGFVTGWAFLNTRASHQDKYGTFFEFTPTATEEVARFEAIRRSAGGTESKPVPFERAAGRGGRVEFVEAGNPQNRYALKGAGFMTVALLVPGPNGEKVRYNADLDPTGRSYRTSEQIFRQENGPRTLEGEYPGSVRNPDTLALLAALAINAAHFAVWFALFAFVIQYGAGESLGFAAAFGLLTMLAIMPLLFQSNSPAAPPVPVAPAPAAT